MGKGPEIPLGYVAGLRRHTYWLLASMLLYPEEERLETLRSVAADLQDQGEAAVTFAFYPSWQRLTKLLAGLPSSQVMEEEYVSVFMHSPQQSPCLPYESAYVDPDRKATGWTVALLEQEYAEAGLALSPSLMDQPDHAAVELEFMAFLCGSEAEAWARRSAQESLAALRRQGAFLRRHLGLWFPMFAQEVAATCQSGIYHVVAEAALAFITHDQGLISALANEYQGLVAHSGGRADTRGNGSAPSSRGRRYHAL